MDLTTAQQPQQSPRRLLSESSPVYKPAAAIGGFVAMCLDVFLSSFLTQKETAQNLG
jgi:hypothetical protein